MKFRYKPTGQIYDVNDTHFVNFTDNNGMGHSFMPRDLEVVEEKKNDIKGSFRELIGQDMDNVNISFAPIPPVEREPVVVNAPDPTPPFQREPDPVDTKEEDLPSTSPRKYPVKKGR